MPETTFILKNWFDRPLARHTATIIRKPVSTILLFIVVGGPFLESYDGTQVSFIAQQPSSSSVALSLNPNYTTVILGSSVTSDISVSSLNGYSGPVTFSQPVTQTGITATLSTYSVSVTPSNPATTILNVTVRGPIPRDTHDCIYGCMRNVSVTGSTGSDFKTVRFDVLVYIPNFQFWSDQNIAIIKGRSGSANLTMMSVNFSGDVSVTSTVAPAGPRVTVNPANVFLVFARGGYSTVTIDTARAPAGEYNVTVTATAVADESLSHRVTLYVTVWLPPAAPAQPSTLSLLLGYLPAIGSFVFIASFLVITALLDRRTRKPNPGGDILSPR
jgi:hypothetical protein